MLTVPTIGDTSVEEYATKVFENWKLGKKGTDNGVLVVVVPNDHKMRIEVGYGLEGTLTDVVSSRIIRNIMTPRFKAGDYDGGIETGVSAIVAQLEGKGDVTSSANAAPAETTSGSRTCTSTIRISDGRSGFSSAHSSSASSASSPSSAS